MRQGNQQDHVSDDRGDRGDFGGFGYTYGDTAAGMRGGEQFPHSPGEFLHPPVVRTPGDCAVVELSGEIDLLALQRMAPLIDAVAAGPYRVVAIDLTGTTFFDCSGLSLLARAHRGATERGARVAVVCRHRLTLRVIALSGLTEAVAPVATVEEALRPSP
ncbi:STAS domain-containing protein [Streptomyces sp. NPDC049813]|uniref:STAS domain-containing protein n=1 Tax=Streptomyces sp. NPDC049813 TaxID=3365597 RepID=UPI00378F58F4